VASATLPVPVVAVLVRLKFVPPNVAIPDDGAGPAT
jgi:hypothetical protein